MLKRRPSSWEHEDAPLSTHERADRFGHEEDLLSPDLSEVERIEPSSMPCSTTCKRSVVSHCLPLPKRSNWPSGSSAAMKRKRVLLPQPISRHASGVNCSKPCNKAKMRAAT